MKRSGLRSRITLLGLAMSLAISARASGPNGTDDGWAIDDNGRPLLTAAKALRLSQGGTGWIRIGMRRIPGQTGWDDQHLGYYDVAINNAIAAGLQPYILIGEGTVPGGQTAWDQNNYETTGGDGQNDFIDRYVNDGVIPIVSHFHDRVKVFEIWNEPNAWTRNPAPGVYEGGTWIYPSNYGWVLTQTWIAVHDTLGLNDVTLFFGGVFGHSIGGQYSYGRAGAQYIHDVYDLGIHVIGNFASVMQNYGSYPLDGIGQHIYIDQGGVTTTEHIIQYLDWVRQAYVQYEGDDTPKKVFITELGWTTASVSQAVQDQDLRIAFAAIEQRPHVKLTTWFRWQDVANPSLKYGVLDTSGNPKQSYAGYQYYQTYEGRYSDHTTNDDILSYYNSLGQPALGNPYDNGGTAWVHTWGNGSIQEYNGGSNGKLAIMSSGAGTFQINDVHGMWDYYLANHGITTYGYPTNDEYETDSGTQQDFQTGYFTWDPANGAVGHCTIPGCSPGDLRLPKTYLGYLR